MSEPLEGGSSWRVYLTLAVFALSMIAAMLYALATGTRMSAEHGPQIYASMAIKLEATKAHLWFEEILNGDRHESMEDVWRHLDSADWYARAMLQGGRDTDRSFTPLSEPILRERIAEVRAKLQEFRDVTLERWNTRGTSTSGTEIDQRYDAMYGEFIDVASVVESRLQQQISHDLLLFRRIQIALISGALLLSVLVGLVLARHINRRRSAERHLRRSEEQLRLVFGRAPIAIAVVDSKARLVRVNAACSSMLGYTEQELLGLSLREIADPQDVEAVCERVNGLFSGETARFDLESRFRHRDGRVLHGRTQGNLIPGGRERPAEVVAQIIDRTDQVLAEQEAREHREKLAHVTRLSTMGEMAAAIAHEINQPLTAIATAAQACRRLVRGGRGDLQNQTQALELIGSQALRAGEVIRRLRSFVGRGESRRETVDINEISREAVKLAQVDNGMRSSSIRLDLDEGLPPVVVDSIQIQQVLLNLIRNGLEAMQDEDTQDPAVTVRTGLGSDEEIEISVVDLGSGIAEEFDEKIFTPFQTTKPSGMGIGLSLSRSIVQSHGGRMWFVRNPHRGTTFMFTLPTAVGGPS